MKLKYLSLAAVFCLTAGCAANQPHSEAETPATEVKSPEPEPASFGAGEMENPARTFYVSTRGDDKANGLTPETAWRTVKRGVRDLRAGDTLLIDEGEYRTREASLNVRDGTIGFSEQCGKPGAPIRIAGMPGKKVVLTGADFLPNPAKPVEGKVYEFPLKGKLLYNTVMESPSGIKLQQTLAPEIVKEYPGTYYFDEAAGRLLVHYAAEGQEGVRVARDRIGIRIHGSYVLVENLTFQYYYEAIYARMNMPYDKNAAEHITIRDCRFFHNYKNGIVIDGASFSLITRNAGMKNGEYGTVMMMGLGHDNLYMGNWFGPSPYTERQRREYEYNYALGEYGFNSASARNYVIGNVLEDKLSFRWKPQALDARFEDNMCFGRYHVESSILPIVIARNWFGGKVSQKGIGDDLWEKDFEGTPIVFKDNVRGRKDFNPENKIVFEAEKLRMTLPEPVFPEVTFTDVQAKFIEHDSAAICWTTPECDGWGEVAFREKGGTKMLYRSSSSQGVRHAVGLTGLKADTEYEYRLTVKGRRGQKKSSDWYVLLTAKDARKPKVLEVGPGKLTLDEASLAAMPGDTVKLLPGRHTGQFIPIRSGTAEKPITLKGEPGAVIDGQMFHAPLIRLDGRSHFIVDGVSFVRPESIDRTGLILVDNCRDITVRNCRADFHWEAGPMIRGRGCSNILFENNISNGGDYPVTLCGDHITVNRNTIVNATMWSTAFWHNSDLTVTNNIFYRPCIENKRNTALAFYDVRGKIVSDGNVFWSPVPEHPTGGTIMDIASKVLKRGATLKEWQEVSGLDLNSIHADPLFVDYEHGDFRLKEGSPAKGKGAELP